MTRSCARTGTVLALAVLVLVALQLLAHGALLAARAEWAASLAGLHLLQARASADAGALAVAEGGSEAWDSVSVGASARPVTGSLAGHPFQGRMRRVSREYWLAEGRGRSGGETWGVTVQSLVWVFDPRGRIAAAAGAAEVGGALSGADRVAFDREVPTFCVPWRAALDSLVSPQAWGRAHAAPPVGVEAPSLGRLGEGDLMALLPGLNAASGSPGPELAMGRCDGDAPWNWGDPEHPGAPCGARLVARAIAGDLRLGPGVGQGVVVVGGNLHVAGTRFDGVLLVAGDLVLRDGALVKGMARVGGDLDVSEDSRIHGSPCRALRALDFVRSALRVPVRVREVGALEGGG